MERRAKRVFKTARNWVNLFVLANGRTPTLDELKEEQFEDLHDEDLLETLRANVLKELSSGKDTR